MFPQYHGGDPTHGYYTLGDDDEWRLVAMNDQGIGYWTTEEGEQAGWMHRAVINPETGMVRLDEEGNPLMYVVPTVSGAFTPSGQGGSYETNPFDYGFSSENNWGGPDMEGKEWLDQYVYNEKYKCECLECGEIVQTDEHCRDIQCPECGGEMRRTERPGPGNNDDELKSNNCPVVLGLGSMFVTTLLFTAMIFVSYKTVKWVWTKIKK